jgi:hypothetical protein
MVDIWFTHPHPSLPEREEISMFLPFREVRKGMGVLKQHDNLVLLWPH